MAQECVGDVFAHHVSNRRLSFLVSGAAMAMFTGTLQQAKTEEEEAARKRESRTLLM